MIGGLGGLGGMMLPQLLRTQSPPAQSYGGLGGLFRQLQAMPVQQAPTAQSGGGGFLNGIWDSMRTHYNRQNPTSPGVNNVWQMLARLGMQNYGAGGQPQPTGLMGLLGGRLYR